jgi:2-succinyl-5-enolpyruvyl-6-hydroxy-3-cyclohexene-1-carboxylate synthase
MSTIIEKQTNEQLALHVIESAMQSGVTAFCVCPGARNTPFYTVLKTLNVQKFFNFEERSAAFFCLGQARRTNGPIAVIVTSGTAVGELLPATMEGYYNGVPLLLISADRPRSFRGTGAPQAVEQKNIFGVYAPFSQDIAAGESCNIHEWDKAFPAHLNVCFEEPFPCRHVTSQLEVASKDKCIWRDNEAVRQLDHFLHFAKKPLVLVSTLPKYAEESVTNFLAELNAPVILEGTSCLREDPRLKHLRIVRAEKIWENADKAEYPIDGILRIGGVPTNRVWRDLEDKQGQLHVCAISDLPFSGLSWGNLLQVHLSAFFKSYVLPKKYTSENSKKWLAEDQHYRQNLDALIKEEPLAEASLIHQLSKKIPARANVYLGNSQPIREWDLAATDTHKQLTIFANRGANGIDGQISSFLGLCDMAGPWMLPQLPNTSITIVVVNNRGGQIFSRLFPDKDFLHSHELDFRPFAKFWGLTYELWKEIPDDVTHKGHRLIELAPDAAASARFWKKLQ